MLRIPAYNPETLSGVGPVAHCDPIVVVPVGVASVEIDEHVIDEILHIEQGLFGSMRGAVGIFALNFLIDGLSGGGFKGGDKFEPGCSVPVGSVNDVVSFLILFDDIVVLFVSPEMYFAIIVFNSFGRIVQAPVQAVDKEMCIGIATGRMSHLLLGVLGPGIADVLRNGSGFGIGMNPAVAKTCSQYQSVQFFRPLRSEKRKIQTGRAKFGLENQTKRMFGTFFGQTAMSPVYANAAVNLQRNAIGGVEIFKRNRPFPSVSGFVLAHGWPGIDVNASVYRVFFVAEKMIFIACYRNHGQIAEPFAYRGGIGRFGHQFRIHFVVGDGGTCFLSIAAPKLRIAFRAIGLIQDIVDEQITQCGGLAGEVILFSANSP